MNYRAFIILAGFFTVLFNFQVFGQTGGPSPAAMPDTTLQINHFADADDSIEGYKKDKEFRYINYLDSLLKHSKNLAVDTLSSQVLKGQKIKRPGGLYHANENNANNIFRNPLVRILLTLLAVFFIGFILFRVFFSAGLFKREGRQLKDDPDNKEELITDPNSFNKLITDAVVNKDYSLAIRYLYLQTLQVLFSRNIIEFSPGKPNSSYIQDLSGKHFQAEFASLTRSYEYAWYGKFEIDELHFKQVQNYFKQFLLNI
jgi:hypothetical protein